MHDGEATISPDILARYAGDAAREVDGVRAISGRHGVKVGQSEGVTHVEVHLEVTWGTSIPGVGAAVQSRVRDYLARMAKLEDVDVHVVVDGVAP